jgi:hypothetical protein
VETLRERLGYMDMPTPKIIVSDENGSRELEGQELENFLIQQEKDKAETARVEAAVEAKKLAKAQLLERLGITADEAKLLLA